MKTVLLIEDEVDIQEALAFFLKRKGVNVVSAYNGSEGIKVLEQLTPDLILLDGNMPIMNGEAFLKAKREAHLALTSKIILLSSEIWDTHDQSIVRHVPKPFDLNTLLNVIDSVLNAATVKELSN